MTLSDVYKRQKQNRLVAEVGPIHHVFASQWMFFQQRQQNALAPERHALSFKQRELSRDDCDVERAVAKGGYQALPRTFFQADIYLNEPRLVIY